MSGGTGPRPVRRPLEWSLRPAEVLQMVRDDAHPVALFGGWAAGSDVVASEPALVRGAPGDPAGVFDAPLPPDGGSGGERCGFGGGWIGYLGYSAWGEALPPAGPRRLPAWWFGYYDHVLRRETATGRWFFEALWTDERAAALERRFAELNRRAASRGAASGRARASAGGGYRAGPFRLTPGEAGHREAVRRAVDYIRRGDIFQANICLRAEAEFDGDPLDAFCRAAELLRPPYAAFIDVSDHAGQADHAGRAAPAAAGPLPASGTARTAVASLSPELFLRRTGATVVSRPIKGTARRAEREAATAAAQRAELAASAKNQAENVMIVDLVRNDLSRVCVPGTVTVPVLLGPEPHPGVWHLVSAVEGTLRPGAGDGDLVRAAFPPGSVTGAPKVRALEVIDELELSPREAYTGAIGYRSPVAGLELNVAIRTFEFAAGRAWLGAGGGIVADSDPAAEYAECLIKATPLLAALGAALEPAQPAAPPAPAARTPAAPAPAARTPADLPGLPPAADLPVLLPRPSAGVFTSLRVTAGRTSGLGEHLERLAASVRALYGKELPGALAAELDRCLAAEPTGRLRITVRPVGGPLQAAVEVVPLPRAAPPDAPPPDAPPPDAPPPGLAPPGLAPPQGRVMLRPAVVPGGIGAHKYRDRRLIDELGRRAGLLRGEQVLITDETGELLETDRANLFAVIGGVLLTPPADGRLLPGTTRAAILRAAHEQAIRVGQKPLTLGELASATEVFVANAVAGVAPVSAIDGCPASWPPGPVAAALAAALDARPPDAPDAAMDDRLPGAALDAAVTGVSPVTLRPAPFRAAAGAGAARGTPARPLVILIDNYDSFTWNLAHLLVTGGARVEVVRNDEVSAAQVVGAAPAGLVVSPGPCAPAEAGISVEAVRAAAAAGLPLLGICLGHQAIGAAFGAAIIAAPRPVHGQAFEVRHDGRGVLAGLPSPFSATRYHSLIVAESTIPPTLKITARTDGIPMGIRHQSAPIEGVQFHPESILTPHGGRIIGNFLAVAAAAAG